MKMVLSFQYLGVYFDMKWSEKLIKCMKYKMRRFNVLFCRIRFLNKSVVKQIYTTLCNSNLFYCIICWRYTNRTDIPTVHIIA